jgi:hypothetical protein
MFVYIFDLADPNGYLFVPIPAQGVLSSCNARDRVIVETRNVTVGGHEIQISTKACSADVLASPSLEKRLVLNACGNDDTFTCVLEGGVPGPVRSDCTALENALPAFLASEGGNSLPCW